YAPNNYDMTFHGPVPLREALASSYNVPSVRLLAAVAAAAAWVALYVAPLPPPPAPRALPQSTKILDAGGHVLYDSGGPADARYTFVPLRELPPRLRQAVVATEDASFYDNPGVDPRAILRAAFTDLIHGQVRSGGSTITQQLARNLYFDPQERASENPLRKVREALLALRIDRSMSKDQVLEQYLNRVYFGNLAYGIEAASRTYFGKAARDLDLAESALLVGLLQSPADYDPFTHQAAARARQATVLGRMVATGDITRAEAAAAAAEPLRFNPTPFPIEAPHFVAWVRQLLPGIVGADALAAGGLRIYTTLDLDLQRAAQRAVDRQVAALKDHNLTDAAVVAIDPATGAVRAMVGSADYFNASIDGAYNVALAERQPGSSIKPIVYAAALEAGFTPASELLDIPTTLQTRQGQPYAPNNYDMTFHGPVPLREALASSYNVPSVRLLAAVGIDNAVALGRRMGLTTFGDPARYDLSLTLGGGEVRLLDLTAAYADLAAGGVRVDPVAISRVEDASGHVLYRAPAPARDRVVSPQTAYLLSDILSDNDARAPGFGYNSPLQLDFPAAVKTGTTTDFRDNWTVGYTPDLAVGVWAGNADNTPIRDVSGVDGAAPIWRDVMNAAAAGRPMRAFAEPRGIQHVAVCLPSGLLPTPACPRQRVELFAAGTAPVKPDDYYRAVAVCGATGLPEPRCPGPAIERVYTFVPPGAIPWARAAGLPLPPVPPYAATGAIAPAADGGMPAGAPPLRLVSPAGGVTLHLTRALRPEDQAIAVEALPSAAVRWVELYVDGAPLARLASPPYRVNWQLGAGTHAFRARALSLDGTELWSETATIFVEAP
ncbi:MAG TPA: penicillin-binding protein 1C, partial [Dehalococcoidia bacterium]|nr:penicillin-binding protein 1C [Dehalococcoidia bacterium]